MKLTLERCSVKVKRDSREISGKSSYTGTAEDRPDPNLGSELRRQFRRDELVKREIDRALKGSNSELAAEVCSRSLSPPKVLRWGYSWKRSLMRLKRQSGGLLQLLRYTMRPSEARGPLQTSAANSDRPKMLRRIPISNNI